MAHVSLTAREKEVLDLLGIPIATAEISERINCSNATTLTHVRHLHEKFGTHSREELVAIAIRHRDCNQCAEGQI